MSEIYFYTVFSVDECLYNASQILNLIQFLYFYQNCFRAYRIRGSDQLENEKLLWREKHQATNNLIISSGLSVKYEKPAGKNVVK
jgi:hypothetical protein